MHSQLIFLVQTTSTTVAKSSKSSGSVVPLVVIIAIFAVVYIFFVRPRQQRLRQQQQAAKQVAVGDEVMSAGGIFGRVVAIDGDEVEVEVAPGVVMTFLRRAISARPARPVPSIPAEPPDEPWTREPSDLAGTGPESEGPGGSLPMGGQHPVEPPPDEPPAGPAGRQD